MRAHLKLNELVNINQEISIKLQKKIPIPIPINKQAPKPTKKITNRILIKLEITYNKRISSGAY